MKVKQNINYSLTIGMKKRLKIQKCTQNYQTPNKLIRIQFSFGQLLSLNFDLFLAELSNTGGGGGRDK